jgi:putative glutamine amidotransferase
MTREGKPVIGIPCSKSGNGKIALTAGYFRGIYRNGGIPVAFPYTGTEEEADLFFESGDFDGWLFSGGVDIDPARYGETVLNDSVTVEEERDRFELRLISRVFETEAPLFGICRGVQTMNVAAGGTLFQDIPGHRQSEAGSVRTERVNVLPGTVLAGLVGEGEYRVNTFHHQSVKDCAPGFRVSAVCPDDGIIEAIEPAEAGSRFVLGLQWHPELFFHLDPGADRIFRTFVEACREYGNR